MKTVVEYQLVTSFGVHELNHDISYYLLDDDKWDLHGPAFILKEENEDDTFNQAMVKYEDS